MKKIIRYWPLTLFLSTIFCSAMLIFHWSLLKAFYFEYLLILTGLILGITWPILDKSFFQAYYDSTREKKIITNSLLFILGLIPVSLLITTSTSSAFGSGLVMGLAIHLLSLMLSLVKDSVAFDQEFLHQIRRPILNYERWVLLIIVIFWNVILWWVMLR